MGFSFPIVHAKLSLVFRSFGTNLYGLKSALSPLYYNNNINNIFFQSRRKILPSLGVVSPALFIMFMQGK